MHDATAVFIGTDYLITRNAVYNRAAMITYAV